MNFFEHQDRARSQTSWLIFSLAIAVALIVVAVNASIFMVSKMSLDVHDIPPNVYVWSSALTIFLIGVGTFIGFSDMNKGGGFIAMKLDAHPIRPDTTNADERRVLNIVEEMAIASGVTVPAVYVFEGETINAFAAGTKPDTAVIAVSRGAMKELDRDEMQGVIAHEFSHIFNGDMKLNLYLMGVLHGILMVALVGRFLLRGRRRKKSWPLLGVAFVVIGYVGVFISRAIKSAISRQREWLADASAVQFTRNPNGLLGALSKIGRGTSKIDHPNAEELSHMFFAKGFSSFLDTFFSTHPSIEERLRAIDPHFRGDPSAPAPLNEKKQETPSPAASPTRADPSAWAAASTGALPAAAVIKAIAVPTPRDIDHAVRLRAKIPADISERLKSPLESMAIVYATLLDRHEATRRAQLELLIAKGDPHAAETAEQMYQSLEQAGLSIRLPVLELAIASVRFLPVEAQNELLRRVDQLVESDRRISPFEFGADVLLAQSLSPARPSPGDRRADTLCLLSYLAYIGSPQPEKAMAAFDKGFAEWGGGKKKMILPWDQCGPREARGALLRLATLEPLLKQNVVSAMVACGMADEKVTPEEWEVLRVFCQCLGCPTPLLPPLSIEAEKP